MRSMDAVIKPAVTLIIIFNASEMTVPLIKIQRRSTFDDRLCCTFSTAIYNITA